MFRWFVRYATRIEAKAADHGLACPWWMPVVAKGLMVGSLVFGLAQRDGFTIPMVLTIPLVLALMLLHGTVTWWVPWWVDLVVVSTAAAVLLAHPVVHLSPLDATPGLLAVLVAQTIVTAGIRPGLVTVAVSVVLLWVADVPDSLSVILAMHELAIGFLVGAMLNYQSRAIIAEREQRDGLYERAVLSERQRIAGEVHDLIAHSLSVTLLHLTGARRTLSDGDVDDAVGALEEAERVGRRAMADIRQAVSGMHDGPSLRAPLPSAQDLEDLVEQFRSAGLEVTFVGRGDLATVEQAAGLGLYRVAQEALANVAKHAASRVATVEVEIAAGEAHLVVRNPHVGLDARAAGGSGLTGMATRAAQLGGTVEVGPAGGFWVVDLRLPLRRESVRA